MAHQMAHGTRVVTSAAIEQKARTMYRAENAKNVQPFEELPRYAQRMYREAAQRELGLEEEQRSRT
jgi:hypothetical protein